MSDTILVAEDSPPNRRIVSHLLRKVGFDVIEVADGNFALRALQDLKTGNPKELVAIFSDLMMPNVDGITLLKRVRESQDFSEVPFIIISAVTDKDAIIQSKQLKTNGYLLKPITFESLIKKLKEIFPERTFPDAKKMAG